MKLWIGGLVVVIASGCTCNPPSGMDAGTPASTVLTWPEGARLEVT